MSYIRTPVYIWTGDLEPFDDRDTICVSLPRGKFRNEPGGCDFRRAELVATALAFLTADYPDFVTDEGRTELQRIEVEAQKERTSVWKQKAERLDELTQLGGFNIVGLLTAHLNPVDFAEDIFAGIDEMEAPR